jgi:hypothetical protein
MRASLIDLFGARAVSAYVDPDRVIAKIVVTVDNLDRPDLPLKERAVGNVPGQLDVKKSGGGFVLTPGNFERYRPLIRALKAADARAIVAIYAHYYPLFQQAYRELGYPNGEFNDRLIQVIDHLMQAPDIKAHIYLTRPKVLYEFVDEDLEERSAGHKLLIRLGTENEGIVKGKLNEIRHVLVPEKEKPGRTGAPKTAPPQPSPVPVSQVPPEPAAPAPPATQPAPAPAPSSTPSSAETAPPEQSAAEAAAVESPAAEEAPSSH